MFAETKKQAEHNTMNYKDHEPEKNAVVTWDSI